MERQQTDNLLKSHPSGTYLIRERPAEAERFAISIKYVEAGVGRPLPRCCSASGHPHPLQILGLLGVALGRAADTGHFRHERLQPKALVLGSSCPEAAPSWVFCLLLKGWDLTGGWSPPAQDIPWTRVSGQGLEGSGLL